MKLSEKKKQDIYGAISDAVMDIRLRIGRKATMDHEGVDYELFLLQSKIWKNIHKVMKLDGPA